MAPKRKKKIPVIQKFGEMRYGQWFREHREAGAVLARPEPRVFVKLQNILPSGIPVVYDAFVAKDTELYGGKRIEKKRHTHKFVSFYCYRY